MRRTLFLLLLLLPPCLKAQTSSFDSAMTVVGRYRNMLNYGALPKDSMLVTETLVTLHGQADTFVMKRWFVPPAMMRVEVWLGDSLTEGFCTNGTGRFREYSSYNGWWSDLDPAGFAHRVEPYDFRCPLHDLDTSAIRLSYAGNTTLNGHPLQAVRVERKKYLTQYYLFEKESGLLLFIIAGDEMPKEGLPRKYGRSDWKAFHEYLPVGASLIASEESYWRDGVLTIMRTQAHFERPDATLFNQDSRP